MMNDEVDPPSHEAMADKRGAARAVWEGEGGGG